MSKKKEKKVSSDASLEGAKDTLETQTTSSTLTETIEVNDDNATDTKIEKAPKIHPEIEETFKRLPHLKEAYVNGDKWFFNKVIAKQVLKTFDVIENPYSPMPLP